MQTELQHMHQDIEVLKKDIAVIRHILSQEGTLTAGAKKRLAKARKTPDSAYVEL